MRGLDQGFVINIDHHPGNTMYGAMNWLDLSAAACGEMVFDLIGALGVPLTPEIATHVYIAILTDTGVVSLLEHHAAHLRHLPAVRRGRRRCRRGGAQHLRQQQPRRGSSCLAPCLTGCSSIATGRVATVCVDQQLAPECGGTYDDTEGLINLPLTVKDIHGGRVLQGERPGRLAREHAIEGRRSTSTPSPREFGGGGHTNASGCCARGDFADLKMLFEGKLTQAIEAPM